MAQRRKLQFKRNLCEHRLTADGYRLATVEEVRSNQGTIVQQGLAPVKQDRDISYDVVGAMRLLDGYVTYHSNEKSLDVQQDFQFVFVWKVVVKEKELDENVQKWKTKGSAFYSKDGSVFRNCVYSGISLSQSARDVALQLAAYHCDAEVLFWLLSDASTEELKRFFEALNKNFTNHYSYEKAFIKVVRSLLSSNIPFQLSLGNTLVEDSHGKTVVHYFKELAKEFCSRGDMWYAMAFVELLVNIYSPAIVPLFGLAEEELIHVFTKLWAVSQPIQRPWIEPYFEKVLVEGIERGYLPLVEMMLDSKDELANITIDVLLRVLRGAARKGHLKCVQKLLDFVSETPIRHRDGHKVRFDKAAVMRERDESGRNLLHHAAEAPKGDYGSDVVKLLLNSSVELVFLTDYNGRTPLHIAASNNNTSIVESLLDKVRENNRIPTYLQRTDSSSLTALLIAAKEGHKEIVELLLDRGSKPLKERDASGKTALHYAALRKQPKTAQSICQILLDLSEGEREKALLLWANAAGIGLADDMEEVDKSVKEYLRKQKEMVREVNLLREAAIREEVEMACDLLNRGAEIADIADDTRNSNLLENEKNALKNVIKELNRMKEQGSDRPSMEDRLGRNLLAGGLASLFLNRFIDSPITVGISGEWGKGKSSLMVQTENILLLTSAQSTFSNLLPFEEFGGARKIIPSKRGMRMYEMIKRGAAKFFVRSESKKKNPLLHVLKDYQPEYHSFYKSLACMDTRQMLKSNDQDSSPGRQQYASREVPRILTVQYNAWHYTDEYQAWAGLAVSITKEIERAMTKEQWFSTCWRYSWNKNKTNIWLYVFLPCLLAIFLSGWVAWGASVLLGQAKFKSLKYGSIPVTIIIIVWVVIRSIISVVQPVSNQMMEYMTSPNHTSHLGYQEEVISDINFLKKELGKKSYGLFSFILGKWWWNWFGLYGDYVENTSLVKFTPASEDRLRIITFVDDLDRCEEKVVLQVLSAINLVLTECKINVILGTDKKMIERAIRRNFEDLDDRDIAEKFICKIIQIPLSLPDSTQEEMQTFLEHQLGWKSRAQRKSSVSDDELPKYTSDSSDEEEENMSSEGRERENENRQSQDNTVLDIGCCTKVGTRCNCIMEKILHYLSKFFSICNKLSNGNEDSNSGNEMLALSKGIRLTREMALSKCNEDEAEIFLKLMVFATGNQKLPRELKRLLNYHRLAWNVLSKQGEVYNLPTWKEELVAWIFVCWQWKHEMNILIKGWHKYASVGRNYDEHEDESSVAWHGPSLGRIVEQYMIKLEKLPLESEENTTEKRIENMPRVKGPSRENKLLLHALGYYEENLEKDPEHKSWHKLHAALKIQDVSMKGIQLFQQFRLHCETDHLPWPLPKYISNQAEPANESGHFPGPTDFQIQSR